MNKEEQSAKICLNSGQPDEAENKTKSGKIYDARNKKKRITYRARLHETRSELKPV